MKKKTVQIKEVLVTTNIIISVFFLIQSFLQDSEPITFVGWFCSCCNAVAAFFYFQINQLEKNENE